MQTTTNVPVGTLVIDARALLPARLSVMPSIDQIMRAANKVMDAYGLTTNAGILADIADALIAMSKQELQNLTAARHSSSR